MVVVRTFLRGRDSVHAPLSFGNSRRRDVSVAGVLIMISSVLLLVFLFKWDTDWRESMAKQIGDYGGWMREHGVFKENTDSVVLSDEFVWIPAVMEMDARAESRDGTLLSKIITTADRALKDSEPRSVVFKEWVPAAASPHHYVSISKYYWPNVDDPTAPWERHPANINPDAVKISDFQMFRRTAGAITSLSAAYQLAINSPSRMDYREKAIERIREWFCDERTKMLPNVWFGSIVRNTPSKDLHGTEWDKIIDTGTKEGVLDLFPVAPLLFAVKRLGLDADTKQCLHQWVDEYIQWHETSQIAAFEKRTKNNHGVYYDFQYLGLQAYRSNTTAVREYLRTVTFPRLFEHIEPDGQIPTELARPTSFFYSCFAMKGWTYLAMLADAYGVDMWHVQPEGYDLPILQSALHFILSQKFSDPPGVNWPVDDVKKTWEIPGYLKTSFFHAAKAYQIWDKEDEVSLQWRDWIGQLEEKVTAEPGYVGA